MQEGGEEGGKKDGKEGWGRRMGKKPCKKERKEKGMKEGKKEKRRKRRGIVSSSFDTCRHNFFQLRKLYNATPNAFSLSFHFTATLVAPLLHFEGTHGQPVPALVCLPEFFFCNI